ncbi:BON domain-containing protein [Paraburkholderia sp. CNPSo 3274]|uniref:BON domain-containing protein n=1 Tax=Paraburkholderia sp. CNPSo 3274 TaxID=2940932 RepID=UPI0020B7E28D|nr:BON domain-containing protein [Paraburkholderia sp. CNPSo 3274]MCP3710084.1 BON domain-containing protein [Paraburkholderia sp. CNPSo 3274]
MKSDLEMKRDVEAEIACDRSIQSATNGVEVSNGVVTLSGHPASYAAKLAAQRATARVAGVRGIVVELEVRLALHDLRRDEDIADTVRAILEWTVGVNNQDVQVEVEKGCVKLLGECDWGYQSHAAQQAIAHLLGVTGVINKIRIRGATSAEDIARGIRAAIGRHGEREAKHVEIKIEGGTVTLTGKVASHAERKLVYGAAKATPGVQTIVNLLSVE